MSQEKAPIDDICDYIILRLRSEHGSDLSHLKLQKLLYYCQAWNIAFFNSTLFNGKFQAWIHGPVNRYIYNRFNDSKYMYSDISLSDMKNPDVNRALPENVKSIVDSVLDSYAQFSATQLEKMTHIEDPWLEAREGYDENQRCEVEINEDTMKNYYRKRL